jgi:hypothetical protein
MEVLFSGVRAPSTLGSHLRSYTWGNVLQLEKAGRELLARLCRQAPLLPGADVLAFIGIDSTQKRVYGHNKEVARFGHTKTQGTSVLVRGLNALIAAVSTPLAAPVAAATRLRGGNAPSARGAEGLAARAIGTARDCGATGTIVVRMDSACYAAAVIAAIRRNGARFSVTAPVTSAIRTAIVGIPASGRASPRSRPSRRRRRPIAAATSLRGAVGASRGSSAWTASASPGCRRPRGRTAGRASAASR